MPSRPHARSNSVIAAAAAVVALSACSGGTAGTTGTGDHPAGPVLDAAALAALADVAAPTSLPPTSQGTAQAEELLVATLPPAAPAAGLDAAAVRSALTFTAHLIAVARLDRDYLCGPRSATPLAALTAPTLKPYVAGGTGERAGRPVQVTIGSAAAQDGCGTLRWVGPGTVVGPQTWKVEPGGPGTDVTVRWQGTVGYALADAQGRQEAWRLTGHVGYRLVRQGTGWRLGTWTDDTYTRVQKGWPGEVPVPDGYLPVPPPPAADPAALATVRDAAAAWRRAQGSTTSTEAATDGQGSDSRGRDVTRLNGTTVAAPARGDATSTYGYDGSSTGQRELHLDAGRRSLASVSGRPRPVPGTRLPARLAWTSTDNTEPADGDAGYPLDPFALVALLGETDAAAPSTCPDRLPAARCYTALVVTADDGDPLAGQFSGVSHRAGRAHLVLDVGLDEQGRPAHLRLAQDIRVLGARTSTLTGTTTFTRYTETAPPLTDVPDPATVADRDDVDF